jgi:hypothetical protein
VLREAFAAGVQDALSKFAVAGQPSLSSVGMAPPVTRGLPPAAKPLKPRDFGMAPNPNSARLATTPSEMLPSVMAGAPRLNPPNLPKLAEDDRPEMCTSCRKEKHYGPCTRAPRAPGEGVALAHEEPAFIRTKLRGM